MVLMTKLEKKIKGIVICQLKLILHSFKEIKIIQQDQEVSPLGKIIQIKASLFYVKISSKCITTSFIMLNTMVENENTSFANGSISFPLKQGFL